MEIYEDTYTVVKLIDAGNANGRRMNGGYLTVRFDKSTDRRRDGGSHMNVHKKPNGESKVTIYWVPFQAPGRVVVE